jgi:hypothetical protein
MVDQRFWVKLLGTAGRVFESHLSASQRWSTSPLRSCTSPNKCAATTASMRTTKGRFDVWGAPGGLTPPELDPRHRADTLGPHRRSGSPLDPVDAAGPRRGAPRASISSRTRSVAPSRTTKSHTFSTTRENRTASPQGGCAHFYGIRFPIYGLPRSGTAAGARKRPFTPFPSATFWSISV